MQRVEALELIQQFLDSLRDTGSSGFEGLVASLCEAATGQRFRLSGSGPQEGQDIRSEPGMGNLIKVEAKHYKKSSLSLRELEGEIAQAVHANAGIDLWVLAASCAVDDNHAKKLEAAARQHNIELLLLDMTASGIPRLAVLMSAYTKAVEDWISLHSIAAARSQLQAALEVVRNDSQFALALGQLNGKLKSTLLGYEDARQRSEQRLMAIMADRGDCVAWFNQDVALRVPETRFIERSATTNAFEAWWNNGSPTHMHAVALGEEGSGKTWAILNWSLRVLEGNSMPLVVPVNANVATIGNDASLESFLPKLLADWIKVGTTDSWTERLRCWLALPSAKPIIVLIVDGLNERPNLNWPTFFRTLEDSQWRNAVCVLATDRPGHWRPNCAMAGLQGFHEIPISDYTDAELGKALEGTGVKFTSIPPQLLALIRKPRYCKLVATHFDEMEREGYTSVEGLIFLDIKHRYGQKRGHPLNSAEFASLIRALASNYRQQPRLTVHDIQDLLPKRDRDGIIYQEIMDGGLLVPSANASSSFIVEPTRLVYGLGMLLAEDIGAVTAATTGPELQERIASWLEPHPEMDLKIQICGSALFHALTNNDCPELSRRELLRYWLGLRNWQDDWHETALQCILRCPQAFVALAEDFWRSDHDRGEAQEILGYAFTKYRDDARVRPVLIPAVERWMSVVNLAGNPMRRHDESQALKLREEITCRLGGVVAPNTLITVAGEALLAIDDDGLSRLPRLGLLIISAGSRAPYARAIVRWAVAAAVMGGASEIEEATWVFRFSDDDLETPLLDDVTRLLNLDTPIASNAAHRLLECLGTSRAAALARAHPTQESEHVRQWREAHAADPCLSWMPWSEEECLHCMHRTDLSPVHAIKKLGLRVMNPNYPIGPRLLSRACTLMSAIHPERLRTDKWRASEDYDLKNVWPLLASRAPDQLADFLRAFVRTLPTRPPPSRRQLAFWLEEFTHILGQEEVSVILHTHASLQEVLLAQVPDEGNASDVQITEDYLFQSVLPHLTVESRLSSLLARPASARDLMDFQLWFEPLPAEQFQKALGALRLTGDSRLIHRTLWFLASTSKSLTDSDRDLIVSLMSSSDFLVRGSCMRFACVTNDGILGRRIVDLGRSSEINSWEARWEAQLICKFSSHLPFEAAASRLHPATAGYLLEIRGNNTAEIDLYAKALHEGWQKVISATDPQLAGLPVINAKKRHSRLETDLPEFFDEGEPQTVTFKDWTTTWTSGRPPARSMSEAFAAMQDDPTPRINQRRRERVETLIAAWTTPAFDWFGRDFSRAALRTIYGQSPELVEHWIKPALSAGPEGRIARLRLGSFLVDLCAVLLQEDPARGLKLWMVLYGEQNVPIRFNMAEEAFLAPDSSEVSTARHHELARCLDDQELSRLAQIAETEGRSEWLKAAVLTLIDDPIIWKRAKGLMLASFSNIDSAKFEKLVERAQVTDTWIEHALKTMRENVRANELAQHWYRTYLTEPSIDKAWGAYQVMLACGDMRFYTWRDKIESETGIDIKRKMRFVSTIWQRTRRALDKERERKDHFCGYKVSRGQFFPFMRF